MIIYRRWAKNTPLLTAAGFNHFSSAQIYQWLRSALALKLSSSVMLYTMNLLFILCLLHCISKNENINESTEIKLECRGYFNRRRTTKSTVNNQNFTTNIYIYIYIYIQYILIYIYICYIHLAGYKSAHSGCNTQTLSVCVCFCVFVANIILVYFLFKCFPFCCLHPSHGQSISSWLTDVWNCFLALC